jgi:hypothetical protein
MEEYITGSARVSATIDDGQLSGSSVFTYTVGTVPDILLETCTGAAKQCVCAVHMCREETEIR